VPLFGVSVSSPPVCVLVYEWILQVEFSGDWNWANSQPVGVKQNGEERDAKEGQRGARLEA